MGRAYVGISGWTYAGWRGVFYPHGLARRRELEYASRQLNAIEINGTFYRLQRPENFVQWLDETPPGSAPRSMRSGSLSASESPGGNAMPADRIAALQRMLERNPDDTRARFGLALEYEKLERWRDAAEQLRAYLRRADDEGNAWGRLGHVLRQLGDDAAAQDAYRRGIDAANRHGHPSMAFELEQTLGELSGDGR